MTIQWIALHLCYIKPETKMWKQEMRKTFEPRNQLACPLPHESAAGLRRQTWAPSAAPSELLPRSGYESPVQCRYWLDLRLTALLCFPVVHSMGNFHFQEEMLVLPKFTRTLLMPEQAFTPVTFLWWQPHLWKIWSPSLIQLKTTLTRRDMQCFNFLFRQIT